MTQAHWAAAFAAHWRIEAELTRLDGEYDLNFLALAADGAGYIVKAMRPGCPQDLVDMQVQALDHIARAAPNLPCPRVIRASNGAAMCAIADETGAERLVWVINQLPGRCYAKAAPKSNSLIHEVGAVLGQTDAALADFQHPGLERDFKWNLMQAGWIADDLDCIADPARRALLTDIHGAFAELAPDLAKLPQQAIHNDANDYNIIVSGELSEPRRVSGLIDLGDMCNAPRVCDLAIAAAYIVLDHPDPEAALAALVSGYHSACPLTPAEVDMIWPLLRARLAVSVVNSTLMAAENPDDPYVTISQAPAWRFLEGFDLNAKLVNARLRAACGLPVVEGADRVLAWLNAERGNFAPLMGADLSDVPMGSLSVENATWPQNPFDMPLEEAARVGEEYGTGIWLGYYNEPRLIYTAPAFRKGRWKASNRRTVHLGVDGFAPAGAPLYAPLAGEVFIVENRAHHLDYGGTIILRHETPAGDTFYTLYGHLDPECCDRLKPGDTVARGEAFCRLGDPTQNGGWAPHVHFQLAMTTDGIEADWPGVGDPDEMYLWHAICPNPAALMNLPDDKTGYQPTDKGEVLKGRRAHFGGNLSLTYSDPVMLLRGWKHHLFDEWGRPYLDAYNNVPHVGHAHPRIQAVAADQLKRMNSNTRYLHPAQVAFAEKVLSKLPAPFEVCFFVNSGTEANELALRLARAHTGAKGMVTPDHGYHGNTTGVIDISAYKFNAKGGVGQSDWVELVEVADDYRGRFKRDDANRAQKFADLVDPAIAKLKDKGHGLAGFIAETFPSVGGQIIPPKGYLPAVYEKVRAAGGICIADEVQTGLGRLGDYYFGFEHQGALPDIVVMGKPIGNGHPLGVLVTTRAIADSFAKGPEFFSTFGGSTLSCRIGKEVLDIVDDEGLQQKAKAMGDQLMAGLRQLEAKHACVGDVRGMGLFLGLELINADGSEATGICSYVKNRMRDHRILIGSEGPKDNILKIRPPLTIDSDDVEMIVQTLDLILDEVAAL
ncbi:aminotransferase class III-fold pyridoxal phosphate-dependent enzyme [Phaeobacter gallaeciensis]|uniref:aminotransferase class III-fold pyridoxal phosphate-dependent enzyme n=1 Tax=Phaeobacter gallaeciensis TaxID=60890 RepID=UPI00238045D0|nr:aminotransferase class III-fold pyridoxal phosphate-dependent enzyme [Phaeobacter gallaeciensis]MDE4276107.1 aminotransferase class III-fold pyridoxal phosphate-dependent enzyme [Phaeobacter gallaeciensis]MDE4301384.1 aminotransferase class III-fold pyridoxal phosphate-dependent enzyme [Phaeobacter gallaeciensis]MDE5186538.1 aminotransferase class III-fold pyridoxal phosphate-dependent enzyme [Phaeobacter gallaeciensis]